MQREREYRTLAVFNCAPKHPLLWACFSMEGLVNEYFMKGVFIFRPPQKFREMPRGSLNLLLNFLKGNCFEPLELAILTRLTQKTLFLFLLASGRRKENLLTCLGNLFVLMTPHWNLSGSLGSFLFTIPWTFGQLVLLILGLFRTGTQIGFCAL